MTQSTGKGSWFKKAAGILCIGLGIVIFVWVGMGDTYKSIRSQTWPSVAGTITQSTIAQTSGSRGKSAYRPEVVYTYTVDGQLLEGATVYFSCCDGSQQEAASVTQRYPEGKTVTVYYDPENTRTSTLEPGLRLLLISRFVAAAVPILCGCLMIRSSKQQSRP